MSRVGLIVCDDCGRICPGRTGAGGDGDLIPTGTSGCPDCGGDEWSKLVDNYDGYDGK